MRRIALYVLGGLLILGGVAYWQRDSIRIWFLAQKLDSQVETERNEAVERLAAMDALAFDPLLELLTRDQPELCETVASSLASRCDTWPEGSPLFDRLGEEILARYPNFSGAGQYAALCLWPYLLNQGSSSWGERVRPQVLAALSHPDAPIRVRAIILAQRSDVKCLESVVPLLKDSAAEVRRAAMLAVGPSPVQGEPLIATEALLPWLHDSDPSVRHHCEIALSTRGLSPTEIRLSRRITDTNPVERLKALLEFPSDDDDFHLAPWLDRLSRDRDSAVRAGAARVAVERGIHFDERLNEMIESDPDQSVRKIVEHYRNQR